MTYVRATLSNECPALYSKSGSFVPYRASASVARNNGIGDTIVQSTQCLTGVDLPFTWVEQGDEQCRQITQRTSEVSWISREQSA